MVSLSLSLALSTEQFFFSLTNLTSLSLAAEPTLQNVRSQLTTTFGSPLRSLPHLPCTLELREGVSLPQRAIALNAELVE